MVTFEGRDLKIIVVTKVDKGNGFISITTDQGIGFGFSRLELDADDIVVGGTYVLETKSYSLVTGLMTEDGVWLVRWSDQEMERRQAEQIRKSAEKHRKGVLDNAGDLIIRTLALPSKQRGEMLDALKDDEFAFGYMGWEYTLVTYELIVVMGKYGVDSMEAESFMSENGMSGNQVEFAKWVVNDGS